MGQKLIFLDIDGTLLPAGKTVHEAVKEGIKTARANGHKIFICTGRPYKGLPEELKDVEIDGVIGNAGSDIWIGGKNIHRASLSVELIQKARQVFDKIGCIYMLENYEGVFISDIGREVLLEEGPCADDNPELARWKEYFRSKKNVRNIEEWEPGTMPVPKVTFILRKREDLETVFENLKEDFYIAIFPQVFGDLFNGELISRTDNKGTAIRRTAEYLKADMADTIAFGDSMNDYQMIEAAACGVVMGNGDEKLKAIADSVCESVDEDGVIRELERMHII